MYEDKRPVPSDAHVSAAVAEDVRNNAIRVTMLKYGLTWPAAEKKVDAEGAQAIMDAHNSPTVAEEPTPAVVNASEEPKAAEPTSEKKSWGKTATAKKQ